MINLKKNLVYILVIVFFFGSTPLYVHGKEITQCQRTNQAIISNSIRAKSEDNKFEVNVSISKQKIFIYKNSKFIKSIICSTGLPGNDTPIGHSKIDGYYGLNFYSDKYKEGAKYWVGFIGSQYLFHSVPTNKYGKLIQSEANKLGIKASHGCIRMSVKDSYWFYKTIPQGADVTISK